VKVLRRRWYLFCNVPAGGGIVNPGASDTEAMTTAAARGNTYRVEISGWDAKENFFVEKTSLDWRELEGKTVELHATVRLDRVLSVRLLRTLGGGADFPVPHRAMRVEDHGKDASCKDVGLEQLQPRRGPRASVEDGINRVIESSVDH
jgi:hypothetical protein